MTTNEQLRTKDIIYFRKDYSGGDIKTKAYEVYNNIWLIPERYKVEQIRNLKGITNPVQFGVYSKFENSREYKENLIKYFASIQSYPILQELFSAISAAVPIPKDSLASNTTLHCLENGVHTHDVVANLVIWGPGSDISVSKLVSRDDDNDSNGKGSSAEVILGLDSLYNISARKLIEPGGHFIYLFIAALYRLYGLGLNKISYPRFQSDTKKEYYDEPIEDMLKDGGVNFSFSRLMLSDFLQEKYGVIDKKLADAKKLINEISVSENYSKLLALKYSLSLDDLLSIDGSQFCDFTFPALYDVGLGSALVYFTGPQAITNPDTNKKPNGLYLKSDEHVIYEPNPKFSYDSYILPTENANASFFKEYSFSSDYNSRTIYETTQNPLYKVQVEEINKLKIADIANRGLNPIFNTTKVDSGKHAVYQTQQRETLTPTFELVSQCVYGDEKWEETSFSLNLTDSLMGKNCAFVFSSQLCEFLTNKKDFVVKDKENDLTELNRLIYLETTTSSSIIDFNFTWNPLQWINIVTVAVTKKKLVELILSEDSSLFSNFSKLELPDSRPVDKRRLTNFLFYQWYVKRYSKILSLEGSLFRILDNHFRMILKVAKNKFGGPLPELFLNEFAVTASKAQFQLHQLLEQLMYADLINQLDTLESTLQQSSNTPIPKNNFNVSYQEYRLVMMKNIANQKVQEKVSGQLKIDWYNIIPKVYFDNEKIFKDITNKGDIRREFNNIDGSPFNRENSFLFYSNSGFEATIVPVGVFESIIINFTIQLFRDTSVIFTIGKIELKLSREAAILSLNPGSYKSKITFDQSILPEWLCCEIIIAPIMIYLKDKVTNRILAAFPTGQLYSINADEFKFSFYIAGQPVSLIDLSFHLLSAYQLNEQSSITDISGFADDLVHRISYKALLTTKSSIAIFIYPLGLKSNYYLKSPAKILNFIKSESQIGERIFRAIPAESYDDGFVSIYKSYYLKTPEEEYFQEYVNLNNRGEENAHYRLDPSEKTLFRFQPVYVPEIKLITYLIVDNKGEAMSLESSNDNGMTFKLVPINVEPFLIHNGNLPQLSIAYACCLFEFL